MNIIKQRSNDKNSKQINKFKNALSNNCEFFSVTLRCPNQLTRPRLILTVAILPSPSGAQLNRAIQQLWTEGLKKKKKNNQTWLTSWWGWRRGSVKDLALELELLPRPDDCLLELTPVGYRSEVDRSNCTASPFCCCCCSCCWNRIAAARARSWITDSSNFSLLDDDDRILAHLLEPPPPPAGTAAEWLEIRFDGLFLMTALREKHKPIVIVSHVGERERRDTKV